MDPIQRLYQTIQHSSFKVSPVLNQSLAPLNSLKAGGCAALWVQPSDLNELSSLFEQIVALGLQWFVIGKGSNLICTCSTYPGVLIQLGGDFKQIQCHQTTLTAGAAAQDAKVAQEARKAGLSGLEWLVTIPGSIGGAVYMNAGAHQSEIKNLLSEVHVFHPAHGFSMIKKKDMEFGYRSSRLQSKKEILLQCHFSLSPKETGLIFAKEQELLRIRKKNQPAGIKTFGSVFKNPKDASAWQLIEQAGLRGKRCGDFRISPVHSNFIENLGTGDPNHLLELIHLVQTEVYQQSGIQLVLEGQLFPPES